MINTQYINLNMIPSGVMPVLYCSQYDIGRPLGVVVYNGAESVDLSVYTCTIEATRTDKTPVTAAVTTSGNIGVFETTATMTNQADTYKGKLVLTDGNGKRVASLAFVLVVTVRTMDEDAEEIEEDASLYQQYTGTVQTIIASIRADLAAEITARQNAISTEASTRAAAVSAEAAARQSADNTLQSNINAEASTRATQDASLQSQIDQLIAPSGEAPSAAEVENARIGSDGTVYPTLGDAIRTQNSLLKSHLEVIPDITGYPVIPVLDWTTGIQISNSNGSEVSNTLYKATNYIAINPKYGSISITSSTTVIRNVNNNAWYDENKAFIYAFSWTQNGTATLTPPPAARYMRMSAGTETTITAKVLYKQSIVDILESAFGMDVPEFVDGYYINYQTGAIVADIGYEYVTLPVNIFRGGTITGQTGVTPNTVYGLAFYDDADAYISGDRPTTAGTYTWNYTLTVPNNASYVRIPLRKASAAVWIAPQYEFSAVFENLVDVFKDVNNIKQGIKASEMLFPALRNGTLSNTGNANAISTKYIIPIDKQADYIELTYMGTVTDGDEIGYLYTLFRGTTDGMTSSAAMVASGVTRVNVNHNIDTTNDVSNIIKFIIPIGAAISFDHIAAGVFKRHNGTMTPLRIATDQNNLLVRFGTIESGRPDTLNGIHHKALNARHAPGNPALLTLLHFSDLHHDVAAKSRIMMDAERMKTVINDCICTGDMAAHTAEQIASWWDASVMTCIGNHETASYDASTGYVWTALSMADRDAYYIAPFESGWGITHTSGTSYYYKDYSTQKVRLIVMDAMLYSGTPGAEATAQTTWLANLLSDAITNGYHVLIAIHAPHGGATAKDCSFSRYEQGTMPIYSDCNTPQIVIDTVTAAITNGLHFIGYIVGHTHQDNVWDAESDGSQLMYCVTCAAVSNQNQWKNSDQYRGVDADAYNLVTVDTTNTLVKIVRGGGADIDDHMRTRKAICFNYTTGTVVGEVL